MGAWAKRGWEVYERRERKWGEVGVLKRVGKGGSGENSGKLRNNAQDFANYKG